MNNEYPRARFHATLGERLVLTPDEDKALGPGWCDSIEEAQAPEKVVPPLDAFAGLPESEQSFAGVPDDLQSSNLSAYGKAGRKAGK